ncbi:MAG: putative modification methyltransferase [Candidatus Woesebacteria bacterium GW2011_GWB1_38_8]|uniref:site-specific DNA-methyltransferase (adenine-specific) n=1 Tax=Candidatus Woesebacteria bacterium GW2011_GWB1_38_8 TaxID=1618570 RepID=A0A0G0KWE4_9BACT|nr:MAG: putative modification methyltransferase [Candidatus Woesebacteria bacterium GW2011_GWB1_38_8]
MKQAKNLGQYFTPAYVADFMIGLSEVPKSAKILEPACGKGVFLKLLKEKGYKNIVGYEIDKTLEPITDAKILFKSFVSEKINEKYNLIIGNPPYIRWKNLDQELKDELDKNGLWQRYFNSLCDYLCIFILKSVELLKDNGELIFITPEYWINTKHAEILRNYLVENGYFTDIIHFNETPIFDKVASSILIFKFVKSKTPQTRTSKIKIVKYLSTQRLTDEILTKIKDDLPDEKIERFERDQFLPKERWMLAPNKIGKKLEEFERKCAVVVANSLFGSERKYFTLGDIADIGNGMVSGLDRAFQVPQEVQLTKNERVATISVLKAKNIDQYLHGEITTYIFLNGDVKSENDLEEKYPNFHELLSTYKDQLEKRYQYNRQINFWEWVFLRSFNLFKQERERIFVPCKERISHKNYFRFSYVASGVFPTQDVTAIFLKPETKESIYYILALLNSKYIFEWLKHKGVVKGNIVEFSEKPLASIPIKRIDWEDEHEVKLHNEITSWCKNYIASPSESSLGTLNEKVAALF